MTAWDKIQTLAHVKNAIHNVEFVQIKQTTYSRCGYILEDSMLIKSNENSRGEIPHTPDILVCPLYMIFLPGAK